jgi:hypothetical protein
MKKLLLAIALLAPVAEAQTSCRSDSFGNTTCTNGMNSTTYRTDSFGSTWGSDGTHIRQDTFGNTYVTPPVSRPIEPQTIYRTDSFGNTYGSDGTTMRRDTFGNTYINTPGGQQRICRTDMFGTTTCQ